MVLASGKNSVHAIQPYLIGLDIIVFQRPEYRGDVWFDGKIE